VPLIRGREIEGGFERSCDVLVIGSGASGAVIAAELAEAGQEVVLLEEGGHVPPSDYGRMRPSESMRHMWRDAGLTFAVGIGDSPAINVMMGRCVGGSSLLTGGVCFRIPPAVLHDWSTRLGLRELDERGMEPCFSAVEQAIHVEQVPLAARSRSTTLFASGAASLGHPLKPLKRNTLNCNGCGRCNFGCPHGAKLSVDITYLPRALAAGATIYADCAVDRLTRERDRVTGAIGRVLDGPRARTKARFTVRARRVVLTAGAYASPLLLMKSGFGRGRSGQIGRNLTLHPGFRVMARFDQLVQGWKGALQSAYSDAYEGDRITLVGLFVPPGVLAATLPGIAAGHAASASSIPELGVFGGMLHDDAGGTLHSLFGQPLMTYRMSRADRASVPTLMRRMAEIWFAAGAKQVFLPVLGLGPVDRDKLRTLELEKIPGKQLECASQHPLGTCRMGTSPKDSVVDPDGQSWELRDLFVADGSILPTSLGVNPQLSIMSMATRIAWKLRERPLPN
jgi:choline dehydrogenase-like flavoprotein